MAVCAFFGHRSCPEAIKQHLREVLLDLITTKDVDMFYVGNQGQFDSMVRSLLIELTGEYPHVRYAVVLAYMPREGDAQERWADTMLPEGLESVHPRYAIDRRNRWMLKRADIVVAYVTHSWGGAYRYVEKARQGGKTVIDLG